MTDLTETTLVSAIRQEDGVAELAMRDSEGRNAFSEPFVHQLVSTAQNLAGDGSVKVIVLTGLTDVFAAGAPRELLVKLARGEFVPSDIVLSKTILDLPVPTISAMEGHATGGGLALGLCTDMVLMARESRYGASFMNMGFTPGMGITRLLEHVLSPAIAHEMLYTGEFRRGRAFEQRSGVNYVLPRSEVRSKAFDLAASIAEKPRVALETLKRTLSLGRRQAFEATRTIEAMMHEITFSQDAVRQRIEDEYVE
jgi:polyketide biosynthesis enoyl-CoA hydratase PksI